MRKALFAILGLITVAVCIVAIKFYDIIQTPVPALLEKPESIDSLIDTLLYEAERSGHRIMWTYSMDALVRIGQPAVPKLIEAIETAHDRAAAMNYSSVQRSEEGINHDARILQTRAAMVLGKIGDARAVPVLMKLRGIHCLFFCRDVDEAIKRIQEKGKEPGVDR